MKDESSIPAERDFDAIEAAVMETARGRWFLGEFARRNRAADTGVLLAAITRIGEAIGERPAAAGGTGLRDDLDAVKGVIDKARTDMLSLDDKAGEAAGSPTPDLFARMMRVTQSATSEMAEAAERLAEAAWSLREAGADPAICDALDRRAAQIDAASSAYQRTAERTGIVLGALRTIEERVDAIRRSAIGVPGVEDAASAGPGPASPFAPDDLAFVLAPPRPSTSDADLVFVPVRPAADAERGEASMADPPPDAREAPRDRAIPAALAAIEAIAFRERLKLFT